MKKFIVFTALLFAFLGVWAGEVKIFHTSDVHGFYFPKTSNKGSVGGFALFAGYLDKQREPHLLLDSGDFTSGTYEAKKSKGAYSVDFINELGYNAVTLGNHENDFKDEALLKNIANIKADVLAINAEDTKTRSYPYNIKPYAFYEVNGYKIAVIGVGKDFSTQSKYIKIRKPRKLLRKAVEKVKEQNPDAIVLLIHDSAKDDKHESAYTTVQLTKGLGIDLVLGGHAHKIIQNLKVDNTVFAESGTALKGFTEAVLTFDDTTKKLTDIKTKYVFLDGNRIDLSADVYGFAEARRDKKMDMVVGEALEDIFNSPGTTNNAVDSYLGDLFCDIVKENTKVDIAIINSGAIRGRGILKGKITNRIIEEVLPFQNKIMLVKLSGAFIEKLVRRSLKENSSLYQYSGLNLRYYYHNNRAKIMEISVNGEPLDKEKIYTVAVPDFIANGNGEGYLFKKVPEEDKTVFSNNYLSDFFVKYLSSHENGISRPKYTERIIKVIR